MPTYNKKCPVCENEEVRIGKLHGVAALQSLDSRVGVGGSDLHMSFCAKCGEVIGITVAEPDKIK